MIWRQVEEDERDGRISMIRRMVDMNNPLQIKVGIMRFSVRLSQLFDSVDYAKLGDGSMLSVLDPFGMWCLPLAHLLKIITKPSSK